MCKITYLQGCLLRNGDGGNIETLAGMIRKEITDKYGEGQRKDDDKKATFLKLNDKC